MSTEWDGDFDLDGFLDEVLLSEGLLDHPDDFEDVVEEYSLYEGLTAEEIELREDELQYEIDQMSWSDEDWEAFQDEFGDDDDDDHPWWQFW